MDKEEYIIVFMQEKVLKKKFNIKAHISTTHINDTQSHTETFTNKQIQILSSKKQILIRFSNKDII